MPAPRADDSEAADRLQLDGRRVAMNRSTATTASSPGRSPRQPDGGRPPGWSRDAPRPTPDLLAGHAGSGARRRPAMRTGRRPRRDARVRTSPIRRPPASTPQNAAALRPETTARGYHQARSGPSPEHVRSPARRRGRRRQGSRRRHAGPRSWFGVRAPVRTAVVPRNVLPRSSIGDDRSAEAPGTVPDRDPRPPGSSTGPARLCARRGVRRRHHHDRCTTAAREEPYSQPLRLKLR